MKALEENKGEHGNRSDPLKCLSIGSVWDMLRYLSEQQKLSASSYIRQMVVKEFKKERKKELTSQDV